jgi:hypothetical protein
VADALLLFEPMCVPFSCLRENFAKKEKTFQKHKTGKRKEEKYNLVFPARLAPENTSDLCKHVLLKLHNEGCIASDGLFLRADALGSLFLRRIVF